MLDHRAAISRATDSIANAEETFLPWTSIYSSLACLIEPLNAFQRSVGPGESGTYNYLVTWGTAVLLDGDRVTWNGRVFDLALNDDDQHRTGTRIQAYQTGYLKEASVGRRT